MIPSNRPLPWRTEAAPGVVLIIAANDATVAAIADTERAEVIVRAVNALPTLRVIAYPRRGTPEDKLGAIDMAEMVQSMFSLDDLSDAGDVQ